MSSTPLVRPASAQSFDEEAYLRCNPDVARAIVEGVVLSGSEHFRHCGINEQRQTRLPWPELLPLKRRKLARFRPFLRTDLPFTEHDGLIDYLSLDLRQTAALTDTDAVSAHNYDALARELIERYADGLVLDCGAGQRPIYYDNVVNLEVVAYDSTDVLAIGEVLPFADATFDAVFSLAVLEHVRDPFRCAREITRVLRPGGELLAAVPFLQPLHGYPNHYYNMSHQGLRNLFEPDLEIESQFVPDSGLPIWTLTWMLNTWLQGLPPASRESFLNYRVADLLAEPPTYLEKSFVRDLPPEKNMELASVTILRARKPASTSTGSVRSIAPGN